MDGMGRTVPSMTFYCSHVRLLVVFFSAVANDQSLCPTKTETTELGDEAEQRQQHKS